MVSGMVDWGGVVREGWMKKECNSVGACACLT